jgi:arylsulfatase A-like enzyme
LYDRSDVPLANNPFPPKVVPGKYAMNQWRYVRSFQNIPDEGPVPDELAAAIRHAYYACVSYVDAQVGRLIRTLRQHDLLERTVVVLWSDHGYQLGEHGMWCKHTNFETSTRVPLIVSVPGMATAGQTTDGLVELLDIYPTLVDICGLPKPHHLEGTSFFELLQNPTRAWKGAAFSQYSRAGAKGLSMRTDRWRYNEWKIGNTVVARELYDHDRDPGENTNLASRPEFADVVKQLSGRLNAGRSAAKAPRMPDE